MSYIILRIESIWNILTRISGEVLGKSCIKMGRWFSSERCIQVNLVPHGDEDARGGQAFQILQMIDSILRKDIKCVYRSLLCKECHNNGDSSNFVLKEDQFIHKKDVCSGDQRHSIDIGTNNVLKGESKILLSWMFPLFLGLVHGGAEGRRSRARLPRNGRSSTGSWQVCWRKKKTLNCDAKL